MAKACGGLAIVDAEQFRVQAASAKSFASRRRPSINDASISVSQLVIDGGRLGKSKLCDGKRDHLSKLGDYECCSPLLHLGEGKF